jgi:bifunctional UDP-N-acetylglucosamine pyrophosphorylase / glucosamine-1-phosphate N-acetyltransferase
MAAGEGTRMRSALPKVLHPVCGRPMIAWPALAAQQAGAGRVIAIVSPDRDLTPGLPDGVETVVQPEADGTGGAMRAALDAIAASAEVVVLSGDHPLVDAPMIEALLATHRDTGATATVMTVELDEPGSYGRIVRDADGSVGRIVETKHPESVPDQILAIREVNTGTYCFAGPDFAEALGRITNDNEAGEFYLGDVLPLMRAAGARVSAHVAPDPKANLGVNTRADLALVAAEARRQILDRHMLAGVTIVDPASTWIDAGVDIAPDATIEPGTALRGTTRVGPDSIIGPHTTATDATIGAGSTILRSHLTECEVGNGCSVGPFSYLRPGASLADGSKAGAFVEVKNSRIGEGAKVPHLAYVGDADVGAGANLGAGSITANYDGAAKHRTKIGEGARIGVNNSLVAPVDVGDGAYTGAGAVIREDVPQGALGVTDAKQRNIDGYAERREEEPREEDPQDP